MRAALLIAASVVLTTVGIQVLGDPPFWRWVIGGGCVIAAWAIWSKVFDELIEGKDRTP